MPDKPNIFSIILVDMLILLKKEKKLVKQPKEQFNLNLLALHQRAQCAVHFLDGRPLELQINVLGRQGILLLPLLPALQCLLNCGCFGHAAASKNFYPMGKKIGEN